mmetsp:Transcript_11703/g.41799  ORF Transcript_11703/g.41799 Transcript_11703/m.41799 type:complete len:215 (+) Transcript_11703:52-696(+)
MPMQALLRVDLLCAYMQARCTEPPTPPHSQGERCLNLRRSHRCSRCSGPPGHKSLRRYDSGALMHREVRQQLGHLLGQRLVVLQVDAPERNNFAECARIVAAAPNNVLLVLHADGHVALRFPQACRDRLRRCLHEGLLALAHVDVGLHPQRRIGGLLALTRWRRAGTNRGAVRHADRGQGGRCGGSACEQRRLAQRRRQQTEPQAAAGCSSSGS